MLLTDSAVGTIGPPVPCLNNYLVQTVVRIKPAEGIEAPVYCPAMVALMLVRASATKVDAVLGAVNNAADVTCHRGSFTRHCHQFPFRSQ